MSVSVCSTRTTDIGLRLQECVATRSRKSSSKYLGSCIVGRPLHGGRNANQHGLWTHAGLVAYESRDTLAWYPCTCPHHKCQSQKMAALKMKLMQAMAVSAPAAVSKHLLPTCSRLQCGPELAQCCLAWTSNAPGTICRNDTTFLDMLFQSCFLDLRIAMRTKHTRARVACAHVCG